MFIKVGKVGISSKKRGVELPNGYLQKEYLTFNGHSYILLDTLTSNDIGFECRFKTNTSGRLLFGARVDTTANGFVFGAFVKNSGFAAYGGATTQHKFSINCINNDWHTVVLDNTKFTIDDEPQVVSRSKAKTFYKIALGTWNNKGILDSRFFVGDVSGFKVYNETSILNNLIPCCRKSDNALGMYDIVQGKFFKKNN